MDGNTEDLGSIGDSIFGKYNCYPGDGERNHCLRLVDFARLHLKLNGQQADEGLLYLAAMLHDLGLMVQLRPGTNYLTRTVEIAHDELDELDDLDLSDETWEILEDCLLYNHAFTPPHELSHLAEAFRRAVFTEHTHGVRRFGVSRRDVRSVFKDNPWDNFGVVLADFVWKTTVFEPASIRSIFFPRSK